MLAPLRQIVARPRMSITLARIVADVHNTQLRPLPEIIVVSGSDLGSYVHAFLRFESVAPICKSLSATPALSATIYHQLRFTDRLLSSATPDA